MRKWMLFAAVAVAALGMTMALYAEEGKPATQTKSGTVTKVDVDGKKVTVMVARELTFTVTADTKIVQGDAAKTLADIKVGAKVTVEYIRGDGEARTAVKITITG
jgi:Cu/Ag efflux protein CusF